MSTRKKLYYLNYLSGFIEPPHTGIDGNKKINDRKRHVLTDTIGLVWVAVVHAVSLQDGVMDQRVVSPIIGYLHRVKKFFADMAYKVELEDWLEQMYTSIELEISSRPSFFPRLRASEDTMDYGTDFWPLQLSKKAR